MLECSLEDHAFLATPLTTFSQHKSTIWSRRSNYLATKVQLFTNIVFEKKE
jgi:hypothetical protein